MYTKTKHRFMTAVTETGRHTDRVSKKEAELTGFAH